MQAQIRYITLAILVLTALSFNVRSQSVQNYQALQPLSDHETASILSYNTLFTVYGRAFDKAPILGRLGQYKGIEDMELEVKPWLDGIRERNGGKGAIAGIHLIYAMAIPCIPDDDCLLYLEGLEKDIVGKYIKPAAERGWMVDAAAYEQLRSYADSARKNLYEESISRLRNRLVWEYTRFPDAEKDRSPPSSAEIILVSLVDLRSAA